MRPNRIAWVGLLLLFAPSGAHSKQDKKPLEEARQLLADAGYPKGKNFPKIEILFNTSQAHKMIAVFIQETWKNALGLDVSLRNVEWKLYLDDLTKLNYQVVRRGWIGDYLDPSSYLEQMQSQNGNNNTGWSSKEFDALIEKSNQTQDPTQRLDWLAKAEDVLLDDAPVIPLYQYASQTMYRPDQVKGLFPNPLNLHPLNEVVKGDGSGCIVIHNGGEPRSLDPALARGSQESNILLGLFEGLMNFDPQTAKPVPGVAEKIEVSSDGKTWTFHLRECSWSDGVPVKAQDFEHAWKRVLDRKIQSDYPNLLFAIKGAEAFNSETGKASDVGITARDDRTLVVELAHPMPCFRELLPLFSFYPVRKDLIEKHGDKWARPGTLVGNGPYILKKWVEEDHVLAERTDQYWNSAKVKQRQVRWLSTRDVAEAFILYEKGDCDYLDTIPLDMIDKIRKRPDYHSAPFSCIYYYSFNALKKPFDDKRVRKALSLVIDRSVLCEKILKGGQKPMEGFVPPLFEERGYRQSARRVHK